MKAKYISTAIFLAGLSFIFSSYQNGYTHGSGGQNLTGSMGSIGCGDGACHGDANVIQITATVELDSAGVAVHSYIAGGAYSVKITAVNQYTTPVSLPKFGFGLSTVKKLHAGTYHAKQAGEWGTNLPVGVEVSTELIDTLSIAEHAWSLSCASGTGGNGTVYTQSVPWIPPARKTGTIIVYGTVNLVNGNGLADQTDQWQVAKPDTITEDTSIIINTGINDLAVRENSLRVYPSAITSYITVTADLDDNAMIDLSVVSLNGQIAKRLISKKTIGNGLLDQTFDVSDLPTGIYLVQLQTPNGTLVSKVLKL